MLWFIYTTASARVACRLDGMSLPARNWALSVGIQLCGRPADALPSKHIIVWSLTMRSCYGEDRLRTPHPSGPNKAPILANPAQRLRSGVVLFQYSSGRVLHGSATKSQFQSAHSGRTRSLCLFITRRQQVEWWQAESNGQTLRS